MGVLSRDGRSGAAAFPTDSVCVARLSSRRTSRTLGAARHHEARDETALAATFGIINPVSALRNLPVIEAGWYIAGSCGVYADDPGAGFFRPDRLIAPGEV